MLNGEADPLNAIVTVHPGAGGTESQDWAEMLMRMYLRWAEQQGFKTEMNDYQDGEEAGIKSATFTIIGEYAFGLLAGESGVHRLVRISPFDSGQAPAHVVRVGLCFAGDRRNDSCRSEARRPAHRHLPLRRQGRPAREHHRLRRAHDAPADGHCGAVPERALAAQEPREGDEDAALAALRVRAGKEARVSKKLEDSKLEINFGSQIRSYVLQPYRIAKDHRTKVEVGDVDKVLDGYLEPFLRGYLLAKRRGTAVAPADDDDLDVVDR
jgi:peptide chain release factor 2